MVSKTVKFIELDNGDVFQNEEGQFFLKTELCNCVTEDNSRYDINAVNLSDGSFTSFAWENVVFI